MPRTITANAQARSRGYGFITLIVLFGALIATGRPSDKTVETVIAWGMPEGFAPTAMYVLPLIAMILALSVGVFLMRGLRKGLLRYLGFAALGAVSGMALGFCLDLFVGVGDWLNASVGPLQEAEPVEIGLFTLGGFVLYLGLMTGAFALFGRAAVVAMQVDDVDPDCVEVMRSERRMFALSAIASLPLGLACIALGVARLAPDELRAAPVIIALVAGLISAVANYMLWRQMDEMQRRNVVEGYAVSAIVATLGAFVWSALAALGQAPAMDAAAVFLLIVAVQLVAALVITITAAGNASLFGKPA